QNAVVHGIEDERARLAAGKPRAGSVQLCIERKGHRVSFQCRDDGRGLDLESVRKVAVERGLANRLAAAGMDTPQLIELLMRGGVSTARSVSYVAGRGIGLDVVRETVAALKGEVELRTNAGRGTEVELKVPILLSSLPALELEFGGVSVFAPLDNVRQTLRPKKTDITRSAEGERVRIDEEFIPYAPLGRALSLTAQAANRSGAQTVVVVEAGGRRAAIGVDRLRGIREIILHRIPGHARASELVAGTALDEQGIPRLVLSPAAVVQTIFQTRELREEPKPRAKPPILVVDDSLTTRMLEQSILESAGYEVDLAVSAEEGLELAQKRRYGLCIVDVEMPGMNGFEFIARTRQDAELRNIPCVLVTSRSDPEDKRRGKEVGARAYIVKSEFNQQEILKLIERLMG
ncbi:partial two-component system, chemotaxis family, sensor histidine kinase and response regulator WspE, partial [Planctomycetaceae bacterium]